MDALIPNRPWLSLFVIRALTLTGKAVQLSLSRLSASGWAIKIIALFCLVGVWSLCRRRFHTDVYVFAALCAPRCPLYSGEWQRQRKVVHKYVCITTNQLDTKSNPNPAAKQHAVVSIQLNIYKIHTRHVVIAPLLLLSVVIVPHPGGGLVFSRCRVLWSGICWWIRLAFSLTWSRPARDETTIRLSPDSGSSTSRAQVLSCFIFICL